MIKKITGLLLALCCAVCLFLGIPQNDVQALAQTQDNGLVYKLDFADVNNLGKNVAGSEHADATVYNTGKITQVDAINGKGIMIDGTTSWENYLNLPTTMFKDQNNVTISGWFYHPAGAESYLGEIGIFSPENNKAFRTDQFAPDFGGTYLFCVGNDIVGNIGLFPVYDAWYHMAYVFDGGNLTVYQNGHKAYEYTSNSLSSMAVMHSATSHFYLGQSAYENNHKDYNGGFSDIRVYNKSLTAADLQTEYGFDMFDFLVDEYTFDSAEKLYKDNVRGYDMDSLKGYTAAGATEDPEYKDGAVYLNGKSALYAARSHENVKVNPTYFLGMSEITISTDINISANTSYTWTRIWDIFVGKQVISFMAYQGSPSASMEIVYVKADSNDLNWIMNDLAKQAYAPATEAWLNLTVSITEQTLTIYVNGQKIAYAENLGKLCDKYNYFESVNSSYFTFGAPVYEDNRRITASFDNVRVFSKALNDKEAMTLAESYSRVVLNTNLTLVNGEETETKKISALEEYVLPVLEKPGYVFKGWKDAEGKVYEVVPKGLKELTLTASWEEKMYSVNFDANGGRGEMQQLQITVETKNLPTCTFAKTGYIFLGWAETSDGEVKYLDESDVNLITADVTLYAVWKAKEYTLTFNANGGQGEMAEMQLVFDQQATLTVNAFTREGYNFDGWSFTAEGVVNMEDGEEFTAIKEGEDVTLYAVWVIAQYTVSFNANGGVGTMSDMKVKALEFYQITENVFNKNGYDFIGWALEEDGEVVYADKEAVIFTEDVELFAVWQESEPITSEPEESEPITSEPEESEPITSEQPSEEPSEQPSEQPSEEPSESDSQSTAKSGCGSNMGGSTMLLAFVLLAFAISFTAIKRKI